VSKLATCKRHSTLYPAGQQCPRCEEQRALHAAFEARTRHYPANMSRLPNAWGQKPPFEDIEQVEREKHRRQSAHEGLPALKPEIPKEIEA
jgi:hypothetical protein